MKNLWNLILFAVFIFHAHCVLAQAEVGGPITVDTIWSADNNPYIATSTVQIAENVTLTIEPGVTISKPTSGDMFLIHGTLYAHGTIGNTIEFDGGGNSDILTTWGGAGVATLDYCEFRNGEHLWYRSGHLDLRHSLVAGFSDEAVNLQSPTGDSYIEYNKFMNTGGISQYQAAGRDTKVYIRYNLFQNLSSSIRNSGGSPGQNYIIVNYNSFIDPSCYVLTLTEDFATTIMDGTENFWNTSDTVIIDSQIYDQKDDIRIQNIIPYLPILTEPHQDTPTNEPPIADAGSNQTVDEGIRVALDGSKSYDIDDGIDTYEWIQTGGPSVTLSVPTSESPTFTAPDVGPSGASLTFELTVKDYGGLQDLDECIVNVTWENEPPIADAGSDQTVDEGITVALDGSKSYDIDDGIDTYEWIQTGGPLVTLSVPTSESPTFTAPDVGPSGASLTFELTVKDYGGLQSTDEVSITISDINNDDGEDGTENIVSDINNDDGEDGTESIGDDGVGDNGGSGGCFISNLF